MASVTLEYDDGSIAKWTVEQWNANDILYRQFGFDSHKIGEQPDPVIPNRDLLYLFQSKRQDLLREVNSFKVAIEANTLGDYSEIGFLARLLQVLVED